MLPQKVKIHRPCVAMLLLSLCVLDWQTGLAAAQGSPLRVRRWSADTVAIPVRNAELGTPHSRSRASGCVRASFSQLKADTVEYGREFPSVPRHVVQAYNLKWEVPVGTAAAVLAIWVDVPSSDRIRSESFTTANDDASNALLGAQFGAAALTFLVGCASGSEYERSAGFAAMEAAAYGALTNLALKAAFNREYPDKYQGDGRFWHGGKSFPSGHAATSWAIAAATARRYERKRWVKWLSYGAATGVTGLRYTAKKHFFSDLVIGGALGYVIGRSVGDKARD